jgi:hypothetical protein
MLRPLATPNTMLKRNVAGIMISLINVRSPEAYRATVHSVVPVVLKTRAREAAKLPSQADVIGSPSSAGV